MKLLFTDQDSKHLVSSITKVYPTLTKHYVYNSPILLRKEGFSPQEVKQRIYTKAQEIENKENILNDSIRRTKTTISDIVLCNSFEHFVTFTFAKDRDDINKCKSKMSKWLDTQQKTHGKFSYVIVPEFHKDGKSLHFHALFKGYKGSLHKTNKKIGGRVVYNVKSYRKGFTTLVIIDNHEKVSSYIKKYITKDMPSLSAKKRYWCSTGLIRPYTVQNYDVLSNPFLTFTKTYETNGFTIYQSTDTIQTQTIKEVIPQWLVKQYSTYSKRVESHRLLLNQVVQKSQATLTQYSAFNLQTATYTMPYVLTSNAQSLITWQKISKKHHLVHS